MRMSHNKKGGGLSVTKPAHKLDLRKTLTKLDAEYASEDMREQRNALGQRLHEQNLQLLATHLRRPGIWRVQLNEASEVMDVLRGGSSVPPGPNEFSFRVKKDGSEPTFGTFDRLSRLQENYAKELAIDLRKITQAREVAYTTPGKGDGGAVDEAIKNHLDSMSDRFGELPLGKSEIEEKTAIEKQQEIDQLTAWIDGEQLTAQTEIGTEDLSAMFAKEEKKRAKKARQKARKKEEAALKAADDADAS